MIERDTRNALAPIWRFPFSLQGLLTAAMSCRSRGLLSQEAPTIWRQVWGYLVPPCRGRLRFVRQYDDIYRRTKGDEDCDCMIMIHDLFSMEVVPLSTYSMFQDGHSC